MCESIVIWSVYGEEQFSCTNRARIKRDADQPGKGVESCPRPSTQRASHLCNRPPHKFLKGFVLHQYPKVRCVFNVLRAPPFKRSAIGPSRPVGTRAPSSTLRDKRAKCQTLSRFGAHLSFGRHSSLRFAAL